MGRMLTKRGVIKQPRPPLRAMRRVCIRCGGGLGFVLLTSRFSCAHGSLASAVPLGGSLPGWRVRARTFACRRRSREQLGRELSTVTVSLGCSSRSSYATCDSYSTLDHNFNHHGPRTRHLRPGSMIDITSQKTPAVLISLMRTQYII